MPLQVELQGPPSPSHSLWNHRCPSLLCPFPCLPKRNRPRVKPKAAPGTCGPVTALWAGHPSQAPPGHSSRPSPIPARVQGRTALSMLTNTLNNKGQQKKSRERRANIYKITMSKSAFLKKKIFGKNRLQGRMVCMWVLVKHRTGKGSRLQCTKWDHLETWVPSHHPFGKTTQRHAGSK